MIKRRIHTKEAFKRGSVYDTLYVPYYFTDDAGQEHFILNLRTNDPDPYYSLARERKGMAKALLDLRKQNYRCLTLYPVDTTPIEFLQWVREQGYTLAIHGSLFDRGSDSVDFHGNLCGYSRAFFFRVYDRNLLSQIIREIKTMKREHV